jgi:hypothetical protein
MWVFFFIVVCPLFVGMEGFIVYWLTTQPISVIEEKGEGFENGKNRFLAGCGWPSTSTLLSSHCVLRLKIQV